MFIVKYRNLFFILSGITILFSFYAMFAKGFNLGMDFSGGSIMEVSYDAIPPIETIKNALDKAGFSDARTQIAGTNDLIVKTHALSEIERQKLSETLAVSGTKMEEKRFSSIGPTIGKELQSKAFTLVIMVILGIMLFIAYAFRHVSEPISSWKYGVVTTLTLLHDIIVPAGIFLWLGKEVDTLFVVALLTIMGVSVHDTIVVFDRIRENLKTHLSNDFFTTVGKSLEQTFTRSVNTSLTVMLVVATLYFFGPASTKDFSFLLWIGVFVGTYSSIFIASPLLVVWEKLQNKA
ncbi:MAG: protein translocase subunit SecF [Candidatus Pacebacteria bacterium]|nr:protein translocase subunit SecF [Candidatus Paceibacterota bacterium]